jgi:hypothetical protein
MRLQLVIEASGANLNLVGETEFEIETLARCNESFSAMQVFMVVDPGAYHGSKPKAATIQILMRPPAPMQQPSL